MERLICVAGLILAAGLASALSNPNQGAWSASWRNSMGSADTSLADATEVSGSIASDQIWQGTIHLVNEAWVEPSATLTILPGTTVLVRHCRDYTGEICHKIGLSILGTLVAEGTADAPIVFTSDADDPTNGDWRWISFEDSQGSSMRYAVVEFGQQGINIWNSGLTIAHSTIRWNNWEGIYLESYATPVIERNHIYQNGSNGIAMEQYNDTIVRQNEIWGSRTHGIHVDASRAVVEQNILRDNLAAGLSLDDNAEVVAVGNLVTGNRGPGIGCGEGENLVERAANDLTGNSEGETQCPPETFSEASYVLPTVSSLDLEAPDYGDYELGYIPGDPVLDRYQYIFPAEDETRRVINRIGEGLGLTWSLAWDGEAIWTSTLWGSIYRLDPDSGAILEELTAPSPQPWGMTFDGDNLWISDFAEKTIYSLNPDSGEIVDSFLGPDVVGGTKGLAWDGQYLYAMGWTSPILYQLDRQGNVLGQVQLAAGGGLTYDGTNFWAPCGGICQFDRTGTLLGWIHATSDGTWDLTWDGQYLWASQRTNENWFDDKIYQIEILEPRKPAVSVPMAQGWNHSCYAGPEQPIEDALDDIVDDVAAVYRLSPGQGFEGWFPDRPHLSTITKVKPYDPLLLLIRGATAWPQRSSGSPPSSVGLAQGWNSVCYSGQGKSIGEATQGIDGEFAVVYALMPDQSWRRFVPGREDVSNLSFVDSNSAVLVLVTQGGGAQWVFSP